MTPFPTTDNLSRLPKWSVRICLNQSWHTTISGTSPDEPPRDPTGCESSRRAPGTDGSSAWKGIILINLGHTFKTLA